MDVVNSFFKIMEWLKSLAGRVQKVTSSLPLPKVATPEAPKTLGTAPEPAGKTVVGGRRHRKTHRGGRKHRRTHRRHR